MGNHFFQMDIWMDYLINSSIQQLKLTFATDYLIPSSVFRFDKLTVLDLKSCKLILPTSFDGFKNLTTLRLHSITFDNDNMLEILIKLCPILRVLDVRTLLDSLQRLILHASNLQTMRILGSLSYLEFKEMTHAGIELNPSESLYDLTNILSNLSNIERLMFWGSNGDDSLFKKIDINRSMIEHIKFNQLKKLRLCVNLGCSKETSIVCCILKNRLSLRYLRIHFEHLEVEDESLSSSYMFWNDLRSSSLNFNYLKIFDVSNVHGSESELRFIAYIYEITPMLEVSNIKINWKNIPFGKMKWAIF